MIIINWIDYSLKATWRNFPCTSLTPLLLNPCALFSPWIQLEANQALRSSETPSRRRKLCRVENNFSKTLKKDEVLAASEGNRWDQHKNLDVSTPKWEVLPHPSLRNGLLDAQCYFVPKEVLAV